MFALIINRKPDQSGYLISNLPTSNTALTGFIKPYNLPLIVFHAAEAARPRDGVIGFVWVYWPVHQNAMGEAVSCPQAGWQAGRRAGGEPNGVCMPTIHELTLPDQYTPTSTCPDEELTQMKNDSAFYWAGVALTGAIMFPCSNETCAGFTLLSALKWN